MKTQERRVPSLFCDMCCRLFKPGDEPKCGALVSGKSWCDPDVLRRELDDRLAPATHQPTKEAEKQ